MSECIVSGRERVRECIVSEGVVGCIHSQREQVNLTHILAALYLSLSLYLYLYLYISIY